MKKVLITAEHGVFLLFALTAQLQASLDYCWTQWKLKKPSFLGCVWIYRDPT